MADADLHWDRQPLSNEALVVRGGAMEDAPLWFNASSVVRETAGVWGICVGAADGATAYQIARQMPYRGKLMRVAPLGILREAGFDVVMAGDPPHAVLLLKAEPTGEAWEGWGRLRALFTEPQVIPR